MLRPILDLIKWQILNPQHPNKAIEGGSIHSKCFQPKLEKRTRPHKMTGYDADLDPIKRKMTTVYQSNSE